MLNSLSEFKFFQSFRVPAQEADDVRFLVEIENEEGQWVYVDDAKLVDISITGLGFKSIEQISVGSELRISINFKKLTLDLEGVVVRGFADGPFEDKIVYGVELEEDKKMVKFVEQYLYSFNPERLRDCVIDLALTDRYSNTTEGVEMFSLLLSLFKDITNFGERKDFIENMLDEVSRILNAQKAAIFLINPETNELEAKCSIGFSKKMLKFDYRQGVAGSVFTTGVSLNIDINNDKTRFNEMVMTPDDEEITSVLCHPIHNREDKIIGVIEVVNKRVDRRFSLEDEKVMKVLSVVFSSVFHSFNPISEQSQIRRFSTPFDREYAIIGRSEHVASLRKAIIKLKDMNIPLLIQGDHGAGKSLFATVIHHEGKRGLNSFEKVDLSVMDSDQIEEVLFCDENVFKRNNKGTVFLREIQHLNNIEQNRLLQTLVKSENDGFDIRVISSVSGDLGEMVNNGNFSRGLYDVLNRGFIQLPSLVERKEDIEMLINYFLKLECRKQGLLIKSFSPKVLDEFMDYDWPGNISELRQYVERAVLLNPKNHVISNINSLAIPKLHRHSSSMKMFGDIAHVMDPDLSLKDRMALIEREVINSEIKRFKGNKSKAAAAMGISREALRKKLLNSDKLTAELDAKTGSEANETKAA